MVAISTSRRTRTVAVLAVAAVALFAASAPASAAGILTASGTSNIIVENDLSPVTVGAFPRAVVFSPDDATSFTANQIADSVSVVDNVSGTVIGSVPTGEGPVDIAISPDGSRVFTADYAGNSITEINGDTGAFIANHPLPLGSWPQAISVSPDGTQLWVAQQGPGTIAVIAIPAFILMTSVVVHQDPRSVAFTPDGSEVYVGGQALGFVDAIDTATFVATTIVMPLGSNPSTAAVTPDGSTAYVLDNTNDVIYPIDTTTHVVGTAISVDDSPYDIAISPNGEWIYVSTGNGLLWVGQVADPVGQTSSISVGNSNMGVAVSNDGTRIQVTNSPGNALVTLNVAELTVTSTDSIPRGTPTTTFTVAITDGLAAPGDYSSGDVSVLIRNSANVAVATNAIPVHVDAVTGIVDVDVPTAALLAGTYSIEASWIDTGVPLLAIASPFTVTAVLAATGVEVGTVGMGGALLLLLAGAAIVATARMTSRRR